MAETSFVERIFNLDGAELVVHFHMPAKAPAGEFQCRWSIGWPTSEVRGYACG